MGDIIHSLSVLAAIKKYYPNSTLSFVTQNNFSDLLMNNPFVDEVISLEFKQRQGFDKIKATFKDIKKLKTLAKQDYIIDLQGLIKSALVAKFIKGKRYGFASNSIKERPAAFLYHQCYEIPYSTNVVLRNFSLVFDALNLELKDELKSLGKFLFYENKAFTKQFIKPKTIIIIVGASFDCKIYPLHLMSDLIKQLSQQGFSNILLVAGSMKERKMAKTLAILNPQVQVVPSLDLPNLIALIDGADLVIGADTGPVHMALALKTPSITLFGCTPAYRNTLETCINKTLSVNVKAINPKTIDKQDFSISSIKPLAIASLAKELLV